MRPKYSEKFYSKCEKNCLERRLTVFSRERFKKLTQRHEKLEIYSLQISLSTNDRKKSSVLISILRRMVPKSYVYGNFLSRPKFKLKSPPIFVYFTWKTILIDVRFLYHSMQNQNWDGEFFDHFYSESIPTSIFHFYRQLLNLRFSRENTVNLL